MVPATAGRGARPALGQRQRFAGQGGCVTPAGRGGPYQHLRTRPVEFPAWRRLRAPGFDIDRQAGEFFEDRLALVDFPPVVPLLDEIPVVEVFLLVEVEEGVIEHRPPPSHDRMVFPIHSVSVNRHYATQNKTHVRKLVRAVSARDGERTIRTDLTRS